MFFNFLGVWIGQWLYISLKTSICLNHSVWINLIFSMRPLLFDFWVGLQWIKHFFFNRIVCFNFCAFQSSNYLWWEQMVFAQRMTVCDYIYLLPSFWGMRFFFNYWLIFFLFMYLIWVMWWFNTHSSDDNLWLTHCIVFRSYLMTHLSFLLFPSMVY